MTPFRGLLGAREFYLPASSTRKGRKSATPAIFPTWPGFGAFGAGFKAPPALRPDAPAYTPYVPYLRVLVLWIAVLGALFWLERAFL